MTLRTWHVELAVVVAVLVAVAGARHGRPVEWLGALAVACSFGHAQVADRLAEREATRATPGVACHRWARGYYVAKEAAWLAFFVATGAYSALIGNALFLLYPAWRRGWRARHPLAVE